MNTLPVLSAAPAQPVLTLAEVKVHCRIDHSDEDVLLTSLTLAATSHLDGWNGMLGQCLVTQDWQRDFDQWCVFELPLEPVQSVTAITYFDEAGDKQTVAPDVYDVHHRATRTVVGCRANKSWPLADFAKGPVTVVWRAGFGDVDAVPQAIKQAMLLLIGHWYEHREAVIVGTIASSLPIAVSTLLAPYRRAVI